MKTKSLIPSTIFQALSFFVVCIAFCACTNTERIITVNGVDLHYEESGTNDGQAVLLLHGNGGSHHDLDSLNVQLAHAGYHVYAIDSRGQGANEPLNEYHYADMAGDVYQFCQALNISKPIIYGWSDGGIVAMVMEMNHPGTASIIAASGANITVDGIVDDVKDGFLSDASNPLIKMMMVEPNIKPSELSKIKCPVLVTAGKGDIIKEEHTRMIAESLPKSKLMILDGEDHGSYIHNSNKIGHILLDFLQHTETIETADSIAVN
ncbi:MAG: alpha/beta hydrolase [Prevotellaceae bacterium]|nr:alpha/beta hydrolase [Prevotellaceae bacterium]